MTLTYTYVSTIAAALRKDKMTPSTDKRNFMEYIPMMATELRRLIFSFIDIDTRITMLLDARPYLKRNSTRPEDAVHDYQHHGTIDNDPFISVFTPMQINKIYRKGFIHKLFFYNRHKQYVKTEITQMAPSQTVISYPINSNGLHTDPELLYFNHPIVNILRNFSERFPLRNLKISHNPAYTYVPDRRVPIMALSLLSDTVTFNPTIDYYLRKKAFAFIIAIDYFTRPKMEKKKKQVEQQLRNASLLKLAQEARIELKRREKLTILRKKETNLRTRTANKLKRMLLKRTREEAKRTKEAVQRTKILNRMLLKRATADTLN